MESISVLRQRKQISEKLAKCILKMMMNFGLYIIVPDGDTDCVDNPWSKEDSREWAPSRRV